MDEQEELQRLALEKCNVAFVNKLDVAAILPHLISRHLLTDDDKQLLMREVSTKAEKTQYLLDIIPRKGKGWFESLLECLRGSANGTGHRDLVKELETKFQEVLEKNVTKNKKLGGRQASTEQTQQPVGGGQANEREDIYTIFLESSGNHSVHTFNVKASDSVGNLMDRVRERLTVDYTNGIRLITSNSKELRLHNSLEQSGVHKNSRIVMVVVQHGGHL